MRPRTLQGRLTLLFGISTLVLAMLVGVTVFLQFRAALTRALDEDLDARYRGLATVLAQADPASVDQRLVPGLPETESFAQVLEPDGTVLAASPKALTRRSILAPTELRAAARSKRAFVRGVPRRGARSRLLVGPARLGSTPVVIAVGTELDQTQKAERRLALALGLGLPLLAALVSLGGWFLAGAALAPVRSMVEEADDLSEREPGRRLSVPGRGEELAELARRLNHLLDRIEAAVAHERAFLDDASHELRTPIAIVRGEVELARMAAGDDHAPASRELASALDSTLEEVERLDRLAANLLVLARTRSGRAREMRPVDLAAVARRASENVARAHAGTGVGVVVGGEAVVAGDETALERAVANLVENAFRHAARTVGVTVAPAAPPDTGAVVEVWDDGPGFPEDLLPRAFDRFARDGRARSPRGAGLGLAIVEAIANAHGGTATASNRPEGGAAVAIRLPAGPSRSD